MNTESENTASAHPISGVGAIVLCGGKSSRMGSDKANLDFHGQTMLETVVQKIESVARPVVIVGAASSINSIKMPARCNFVADEIQGVGPLGGIHAGLKHLQNQCKWAFVSGCDTPLIEPNLIQFLATKIEHKQAVIPVDGRRVYGMTAIYRTDVADQIRDLIENNISRVASLADHLDAHKIEVGELVACDPTLRSLVNVNFPDDYRQLMDE